MIVIEGCKMAHGKVNSGGGQKNHGAAGRGRQVREGVEQMTQRGMPIRNNERSYDMHVATPSHSTRI